MTTTPFLHLCCTCCVVHVKHIRCLLRRQKQIGVNFSRIMTTVDFNESTQFLLFFHYVKYIRTATHIDVIWNHLMHFGISPADKMMPDICMVVYSSSTIYISLDKPCMPYSISPK